MQREPAPEMSVHRQRRVADILKRRLLALRSDDFETSQLSKLVSGLSNGRCPTGYRLSLLCLFGTPFAYICMRARVP